MIILITIHEQHDKNRCKGFFLERLCEMSCTRSGRTGRAGADGEVLTLLSYKDEKTYKKWVRELSMIQRFRLS